MRGILGGPGCDLGECEDPPSGLATGQGDREGIFKSRERSKLMDRVVRERCTMEAALQTSGRADSGCNTHHESDHRPR